MAMPSIGYPTLRGAGRGWWPGVERGGAQPPYQSRIQANARMFGYGTELPSRMSAFTVNIGGRAD
jgi:hypothetical protein